MESDELDRLRQSFRSMLDKRALPPEGLKDLAATLFLTCFATIAKCEETLANRQIPAAELGLHAQELSRSLEAGNVLGCIDFLAALPVRFKQARQAGVSAVKSEGGKRARAAREIKAEQVRKYALDLANEGKYPSRRNAVEKIKDRVMARYLDVMGKPMSVERAHKTIDKWLKDLGFVPTPRSKRT
ncbi:hypothetical protein RSP673_011155 [Ralstonia solanacearum P673]|uniref:hypothetical protein n=1 Tax=Ralstonia solanacearum TaxID=305 RepID=UPI000449D0CA|nr:hypothetical protein [Ralstonia solanacearum]EUJ15166.1 hypothetical protein RSP673_07040 [Ralstonia solanacearum P673]MCL9851195.1 hypothetical protein [Ralstonia solanacearum]MCL9855772.1 hypothetical protein [Ralstonia solanacearum]MCL9860288.1 hypothetical protein [Ralstonia solanacearum]MCL9865519.1 hypothetical protein [Ralstonia solanacearum]